MDKYISAIQNWIPYKLDHSYTGIQCRWLNTFDKRFTEPFFDETIVACKGLLRLPAYRASVSDIGMTEEWSEEIPYVAPTAIIFHVSRCGSTMASQLLGLNEHNISLAEVPLFDDILRLRYKDPAITAQQIADLLKAALKFYGQKRTGNETSLFIKTDSWHIVFYKELRTMFPNVPFILLYRSPNEVLNSHSKLRGIHSIPGLIEPQLFGFDPQEVKAMAADIDHYTAKVMERYFELYLEVIRTDERSLLLNYNEGIMPIMQKLSTFCNIAISEEEWLKMEQRSGYHSKYPRKVFTEEQTGQVPGYLKRAMQLYELVDYQRCMAEV